MEKILHKRNCSLDIARIVAVFAVVMIHISADFVTMHSLNTNEFVVGNLFDSLSRIGVPLFLMISGSLFLDENKEVTLKTILSKNVKTLAVITVIWAIIYSLIYNVAFPLMKSETVNAKSVVGGMVNGHYHMWYLYMIMGLYIITPFLRRFVCKENKGMALFFIIASFCLQFFRPIINAIGEMGLNLSFVNTWIDKFHLDFFGGYVTYFLTGWYIVHVGIKQKSHRCIVYFLGAVSLSAIVLYVHFTGDYTNAYENIGAPVFLYSVSVFLALNNINWKLKDKTAKKLVHLSKLAFGVYIVHIMCLTVYRELIPYNKYSALYILVCFAAVTFGSFIVSYIVSKVPGLRKLIRA